MRKYINKRNIIFFLIFIVIILLFIIVFYNPFLYLKTNSKKEIILSINEKFMQPSVNAYIVNKNITNKINKKGKVNNKRVGTYYLKYSIKYLFTNKTITIKVNVVDKEKPIISLIGETDVILCPNQEYIEQGYSATDNYDGDITDKVKVEKKDNNIKYTVKDSSNNKFTIKRNLIFEDKEKPIITLSGSISNKITVNSNYTEAGYSVQDNCDGDITSKVEVINNVDTSKIGTYSITYKVIDNTGNESSVTRTIEVVDKSNKFYSDIVIGPTYINGILIVNKRYALPSNYGNGVDSEAYNALVSLQNDASQSGYNIPLLSGYRSYYTQKTLYNNYVSIDGVALADTYSARPGHSEHQTGLAFDVGKLDNNYGDTKEGIWLKENAHNYGFIIRYPKDKEHITGYQYEPWHIRYVGNYHAKEIYSKGLNLEEYLGIN